MNILEALISFPDTVYIVGTATEEPEVYQRIPSNAFVIAVNAAIELPINPSIWLVGDPAAINEPYFRRRIEKIFNSGYNIEPEGIRAGCLPIPIIENTIIPSQYAWVRTCFIQDRERGLTEAAGDAINRKTYKLHMQATIAGTALQLSYMMGARNVILVGVRLSGQEHANGIIDETKPKTAWPHKDAWDWIVRVVENNGMGVSYLRDIAPKKAEIAPEAAQGPSGQIFDLAVCLPTKVVILGSGPNGRDAYHRLNRDDYIIALNGAILIHDKDHDVPKPSMWICADGMTASREYFAPGNELALEHGILKVWSFAVRDRTKFHPDHLFRMVDHFESGYRQVPDRVRPDATVAGIAMDIAHRLGAKQIVLCGIDMSGDKYFDGEHAPGNCDDAHGEVWDSTAELDDEIEWMQDHGVRVDTMSETKLRNPTGYVEDHLPHVAMLTLAFNPVFTKQAIFCGHIQDYPAHLKSHYPITQNGDQPDITHDLPYRIVQIDVAGTWPELYMLKMRAFFEQVTEEWMCIFDEDDFFTPGYLRAAVRSAIDNDKDLVWNFQNRDVNRFSIAKGKYRSAYGTIVARTSVMKRVFQSLWWMVYKSDDRPEGYNYGHHGCQDANFHLMLVSRLEGVGRQINDGFEEGENIGLHSGERWYIEHLNSNTCSGRNAEKAIDFWMPGMWYAGTAFEQAREK